MIGNALKVLAASAVAMMNIVTVNAADTDEIAFSKDILPVLESRCATCHMTGDEPGGLALVNDMAYASLFRKSSQAPKMAVVEPGYPDQSYLMLKLKGQHLDAGGHGARMPLAAPPLSDEQLDLFWNWIQRGASPD